MDNILSLMPYPLRKSLTENLQRICDPNPAFLKTQNFASWCSTCLMPSSVAVLSLLQIDVELQG